MLYRLLSAIGAIAHVPDAAVAPFATRYTPGFSLGIGAARIAMPLVVVPILLVLCGLGIGWGNEGTANPTPTAYTASDLAGNPDLHGKTWATIDGTIHDYYAETTTRTGKFDYSDFLVCDMTTLDCVVVVSQKTVDEEEDEVDADGRVDLHGHASHGHRRDRLHH